MEVISTVRFALFVKSLKTVPFLERWVSRYKTLAEIAMSFVRYGLRLFTNKPRKVLFAVKNRDEKRFLLLRYGVKMNLFYKMKKFFV